MKILDMSAGKRAVWFDKGYIDTVWVDRRAEMKPTVVADSRALPFHDSANFDLVVFDPPHVNFGKNADMSKQYGHHTTEEIRDIVKQSAIEAHRVSKPDALMCFKWNDHDQKLSKMLSLMMEWWDPLFGHKTSQRTLHASTTCWVTLRSKKATARAKD